MVETGPIGIRTQSEEEKRKQLAVQAMQGAGKGALGGAASGAGIGAGAAAGIGAVAAPAMAYNTFSGLKGIYDDRALTPSENAALAAQTFGYSLLYNPARKLWGSGKDSDQLQRDAVRGGLQKQGFLDNGYNVTLADGTPFNIGADGSTKAYNVDASNPLANQAIGWANPLASTMAFGNEKVKNDFAGYLANAAMSNAGGDINKVRDNLLAIYQKTGMTPDQIRQALTQTGESKENIAAGQNGVNTLYDPRFKGAAGPAPTPSVTTPTPQWIPLPYQNPPSMASLKR